jgi:shikimate dehydrogenase
MTGMLGHPVAENPIDRMFDAVYAHYGMPWQFWKNDIASEADLALAVRALRPLGYRGVGITVPYKVAVIPLLDAVDDDVTAIGAANYLTIEQGRLIGHNNDGKGYPFRGREGGSVNQPLSGIAQRDQIAEQMV